jgi:sulfatase maturation enzyme AslB (radical SAM superfamily)
MDWNTLRVSLDLVLQSDSKKIKLLFLGGEPLLEWQNIVRAVDYSSRRVPPGKNIQFDIGTNGLRITDIVAAYLDEHQFDVQLSFDGIEAAQNYRGKGSFAVLDRLLDRLREQTPDLFRKRLKVSTVQIPATLPWFAESIRYLTKKGVRAIGAAASLTPCAGFKTDGVDELDRQFKTIYYDSLRHLDETGDVPFLPFRKAKNEIRRSATHRRLCNAPTGRTLVVDVDGHVYGCVMFAESYQKLSSELLESSLTPLRMGHLLDADFRDRHAAYPKAARGVKILYRREKKYSSYGRCRNCPYVDDCVVCPVSIAYDPANTDPDRIPDFICAFNRTALRYRELFPCTPNPLEALNAVLKHAARPPAW